jgi:hypothetical protein
MQAFGVSISHIGQGLFFLHEDSCVHESYLISLVAFNVDISGESFFVERLACKKSLNSFFYGMPIGLVA